MEISREAHEFLRLIVARDKKGLNGELGEISTIESVVAEMIEDIWADHQEVRSWRQPIFEGLPSKYATDNNMQS